MKKKILAIVAIVCVAAFALAACGGGGNTPAPAPAGSGSTPAPAGSGSAPAAPTGNKEVTYEVGAFVVAVPDGWNVFPQSDIFGEKDADGNYPEDPESIMLAKGVTDEFAAYSAPMVRVYYHGPDSYIMDSKDFYEDVKDIEGVKIKGKDCTAFSGDSLGYVYQFITYPAGDATYEINVLTSVDGKDTGISWEDPDVMAIMESLTAK